MDIWNCYHEIYFYHGIIMIVYCWKLLRSHVIMAENKLDLLRGSGSLA